MNICLRAIKQLDMFYFIKIFGVVEHIFFIKVVGFFNSNVVWTVVGLLFRFLSILLNRK